MRASDECLETERNWTRERENTFGPYEIYCIGPMPYDSETGEETANRRVKMGKIIKKSKLAQSRKALSMLELGAGTPRLLVALDTLIEKYDDELKSWGLGRSDLRCRLREYNEQCVKKRKQEEKEEDEEKR